MPHFDCNFACMTCRSHGTVRPWRRESETEIDAARDHSRMTRQACVSGCSYAALPLSELTLSVAAVDPRVGSTGKPSTRA